MQNKLQEITGRDERKVEYLELIYDLIFVYIVGRNNSLLHHIVDGFIPVGNFLGYVLGSLAVIQIWTFSTFYINRYGRNGLRDHIFLFINMYLMYYMADATSVRWEKSFYRYCAAWALILLNIGIQYFIELRNHKNAPSETRQIRISGCILLAEAALVVVHMVIFRFSGRTAAYLPILFGLAATMVYGQSDNLTPVDFAHLTERAMLYVVFTFGEMIIAIADYFTGEFSFITVYFSAMAFLIVSGLFLSYGLVYNRVLDREMVTTGTGYMLLHIFLVFALNNITNALEFMPAEEVDLIPKTLFLTGSMVLYYVILFLLERYAKAPLKFSPRFRLLLLGTGLVFVVLMLLLRDAMYVNIALTVVFVYGISLMLHIFGNTLRRNKQ